MQNSRLIFAFFGLSLLMCDCAVAAEIRILATGASKTVVTALARDFGRKTGDGVSLQTDTTGGVVKRIDAGERYDVVIATRSAVDDLIARGKLKSGTRGDIAATSIGVAVKEGAPIPDIGTVDAFKRAMLAATTITYVDPAAGGTSGIYVAAMFERLGLTDALKPKLRLKAGGYVAELVADGSVEIAIHQISEIRPVKGVTLVGGLPPELQSVTVYSGAVSISATNEAAAFLAFATGPGAAPSLDEAGMQRP